MMKLNGGKSGRPWVAGLALLAALVGVGCGPADFESETINETEEAAGPIAITSWQGLVNMGTSGSYRLDVDLNAAGKTWTPKYFTGTFDGNNKTISNLTINAQGDAAFFVKTVGATIKRLKFNGLNVTGTWLVAGVTAYASGTTLENVAVENASINGSNAWAGGGLVGYMNGGTVFRSYAKGTVSGQYFYAAGGLAAGLFQGNDGVGGHIYESFAQVTVSPNTQNENQLIYAGGIVGSSVAANIHDVYAVGNVTGRGGVGGLVGYVGGGEFARWILFNSIYRGDVVDKNMTNNGGWAGTVGVVTPWSSRFTQLFWDRTLDQSSNWYQTPEHFRYTSTQLKSPTTANGGVFCTGTVPPPCGDNPFTDPPWNAGTSSQYHTLRDIPAASQPAQ